MALPFLAPLVGRLIAAPLVAKALGRPWLSYLKIGGAVAVVALIGYLQVTHWIEVRRLKADIAAVEKQFTDEQLAHLRYKVDAEKALDIVTRNRNDLAADLRRQSEAVGRLQKDSRAALKDAELAALRTLQQERDAAPSPTPADAEALNAALAELFGGTHAKP